MGVNKIAVATDNGRVAQHFGRCPEYTLVDTKDGDIRGVKRLENPGHEPGFLPKYLAGYGVHCVIAGGMGPRAEGLFAQEGIETVTGVSGDVLEVVRSYLAGNLASGASACDHC